MTQTAGLGSDADGGGGYRGASVAAVRQHYDAGNEFYQLWLDPTFTYSCAMWEEDEPDGALETAQVRKLDFHIHQARAHAKDRVLDIGCGWGSLLRRLVETHGVKKAVGLTLSAAQAEWLGRRHHPRIEVREENWFHHEPAELYGSILCVAALEAFARPGLAEHEKIMAYRSLFERCHGWLEPGGWMSLQTVAWGNTRGANSSGFIETKIFPDSDLPTLSELAKALERTFEVVALRNDRQDYARTCRVWLSRLRALRSAARDVVGADVVARYETYLKMAWIGFHTGKLDLLRITVRRIDSRWS